jgi:hypothetical protein
MSILRRSEDALMEQVKALLDSMPETDKRKWFPNWEDLMRRAQTEAARALAILVR